MTRSGLSLMMIQTSLMPLSQDDPAAPRWFSSDGCVVRQAEHSEVFVGGTLVGSFTPRDDVQRNLLLVHLSTERRIKQIKLAQAFDLTVQQIWVIRRRVDKHGIDALFGRRGRGGQSVLTPGLSKKILKSFDAGRQVGEVHAALQRSKVKADRVSYRSVCRVRTQWLAQQQQQAAEQHGAQSAPRPPDELLPMPKSTSALAGVSAESHPAKERGSEALETRPLRGGNTVQHVGGWLLLSMVSALGLHAAVQQGWHASGRWRQRLRLR